MDGYTIAALYVIAAVILLPTSKSYVISINGTKRAERSESVLFIFARYVRIKDPLTLETISRYTI